MISNKEIGGVIILFLIVYIIIYADHRLNKRCECGKSSKKISIKVPLIVSIIGLAIYKLSESHINAYLSGSPLIRQNIITDMADF